MCYPPDFQRGDIVRLQAGTAPIKVLRVDYPYLFGRYVWSDVDIERPMSEFRFHSLNGEPSMTNPFKKGDEVRLKRGNTKMHVHAINGKYIWCTYRKDDHYGRGKRRIFSDYQFYNVQDQHELFDTDEGPATLVGQTRRGMYVLEKINDDEEIIYQKRKPQRHMAHTVELENLVDKYRFHRLCPEGKVKVGDLIKRPNGKLYTVRRLNSRGLTQQTLEGEIMTGRQL